MKLKDIREQYPQYDALSDDELARSLHAKYYSQLDFQDFSKRIGYLKGANPAEYDPESPEHRAKYGATSGMSGLQKFAAGYGKAPVDWARGLGQMVGLVSRDDVAESRRLDADLLSTGAGRTGNILSNVALAAPTAAIPGANTVAGSAAIGAGLGLIQPSESTAETALNTLGGGVLGGGSILAGRGISAGYRGGKALLEPLTKGGQERIAARTLEAFAGGRQGAQAAAASIARNSADVLPGVKPTTAELAGNAGIAQLERTVRNNPEYVQALAERATANRDAVFGALDDIAGDSAGMQAASAAREAAAKPLYDAAKGAVVRADADLGRIMARPSMGKAWARAEALAAEYGETLEASTSADISGKTLHYLKMALDDLADNPQATGIAGNEARAIRSTRNEFLAWVEKQIPDYKKARETYTKLSKPLNQMEVGRELRNKLQPALADFGANARIRPQSYAQALREGDATAARVLDRSNASLKDIMTPDQLRTLRQVGEQLARRANADEMGRAVGSNTGQNIVSQNVLRQFMGPFGLPQSMTQRAAESSLLQTVLRPASWVGKLGEQRAMGLLAEAALDPALAKKLLEAGVPAEAIGLMRYQGLLAPTAVSGANAAGQ